MIYNPKPLRINKYTDLTGFDQYEAKAAGWSSFAIRQALLVIWRREGAANHSPTPPPDEKVSGEC